MATIVGGGDVVVGGATLSASLGWPSNATVSIHTKYAAAAGAVAVAGSDMVEQLAGWQQKMFDVRLSPDCDIQLQDGNGGTAHFKGFLSNPQYTLSAGAVSFQNGVNHQASIISAYKSFIYDFSLKKDGSLDGFRGAFMLGITGSSFAELILNTLNALIKEGSTNAGTMGLNNADPTTHAIKAGQHAINGGIFPFVQSLLQASFETTKFSTELTEMITTGDHAFDNFTRLKDCVITRLLQENDDFWQVLNSLAAVFQLMYVPSLGDDMGKFVKYSHMIDGFEPRRTAVLPVSSMTISCGSIYGLPTSQCIVRANIDNGFRVDNKQPGCSNPVVAVYPETSAFTGGNTLMSAAPPWLPIFFVDKTGQSAADQEAQNGTKGRGLSLARYSAEKIKLSAYATVADGKGVSGMLKDWARNAYLGAALQATQLAASIPMDLSLVPGFYTITLKDGTKVGTGVLNHVTHILNCENPQNPQASTQVSFTHIQVEGFKLLT